MKHVLPELAYDRHALAPTLSEETLDYHYGKHHKAYVDKLNELIVGTKFATLSLDAIIQKAPPGPIFNNAAQVWNHNFYWQSLTPERAKNTLSGSLAIAIEQAFGSISAFKTAFNQAAVGQFGSGWAWLVRKTDGALHIETTGNANTPFQTGQHCLLTCDVWEHAYYIDYRNARPQYLEKFWEIVNWEFVAQNFNK